MRRAKDWALAGILHPLTTMQSCSINTCLLVQVFTYVAVYFDEECCQQRPNLLKKKFGVTWLSLLAAYVRRCHRQTNVKCTLQIFPVLYKTFEVGEGGEAGGSRMAVHFVIKPLYSLLFD